MLPNLFNLSQERKVIADEIPFQTQKSFSAEG
jgi:hypothetical protein